MHLLDQHGALDPCRAYLFPVVCYKPTMGPQKNAAHQKGRLHSHMPNLFSEKKALPISIQSDETQLSLQSLKLVLSGEQYIFN